ncbi:sugar ABC transporter ATP-binding protein [Variovorax sp. dw_954]|uniref:sugar ABC transporter ATP-binding protein n=1 Tax=Variovorax sp. dw_954 TaxID=2720078 RepID=UPI001BD63909
MPLDAARQDSAAHAPAPLLHIEGLSKRFGGVRALNNVSLTLCAGEIRAICGENGAGKSTLVKVLTGIVSPDDGTIRLDGEVRRFDGPRQAQANGINLVSQELSVCPDLSVLDNIWLGTIGVPFFHRARHLRERAAQILSDLGAGNIDLDASVAQLNTGERQIVEIVRMLARDTRILILDEPTATLSDQEIARVLTALRAVRSTGKSILYITHRLSEVFELCDTATVMRNGEVVADCSVADVDRKSLIELMLGRSLGEMYPTRQATSEGPVALSIRGLNIPHVAGPIDLAVPAGQIVCLTGQVGCGAEGVVRAICGLLNNAVGEVVVEGRPVPLGRPEKAFQAGVRFVSGDRAGEGIFVNQTVADNLVATRLPRRSRWGLVNRAALRTEAGQLAEGVTLNRARLSSLASELSGGNQQKIAFGRYVDDPDTRVIVMIEPTRGIDVGARAEIYKLMRALCARGYGILVASTDFSEVLGLSDAIVTMYRGTIVGRYAAQEATLPRIVADVTHPEK